MASNLAMFESMILRDEMQVTHQGIAISNCGELLDGQHRLLAIVNTGIATKLMVTTGLPKETFTVIDTGSKRKASDVLSINGSTNATSTAGAIRLYILYTQAPHVVWTGKLPVRLATTTAIHEQFNLDQKAWIEMTSIASKHALAGVIIPGAMSCLIYLAFRHYHYSISFIESFASQLKMGNNLFVGHPLLAYRNKMIRDVKPSAQARLADYIKLFNAYATGQPLKIFKSQPFPTMPSLTDASKSVYKDALA